MIKIDFHTHTYHSYDCLMRPERILALADQRGLDYIVINDHNTIKGGQECLALQKKHKVKVIVGSEIKSDIGDITGIYLTSEIKPGPYLEVLKQIKEQGGLSILNHPYVGHQLEGLDFSQFDFIEGYNGRCSAQQNHLAIELAHKYNKPFLAGSDAHTYGEIGQNYSEFETISNLSNPLNHLYQKAAASSKIYSQLIKSFKKKDAVLFIKILLGAPKKLLSK